MSPFQRTSRPLQPSGSTGGSESRALAGITPRLIVPSSIDVYRAFGRLWKTEPGPPERNYPAPAHGLRPGDYQHRLFEHIKRMDDQRPAIIMPEEWAGYRGSRGFVENVAAAIALAATNERSAGQIYNVAEELVFTEQGWAERIGMEVCWQGRFVNLPMKSLPAHRQADLDFNQHWFVDSSKIRNELGYSEPVAFEEGLRRTIAWERANPPAIKPEDFDYAAEDEILQAIGQA